MTLSIRVPRSLEAVKTIATPPRNRRTATRHLQIWLSLSEPVFALTALVLPNANVDTIMRMTACAASLGVPAVKSLGVCVKWIPR